MDFLLREPYSTIIFYLSTLLPHRETLSSSTYLNLLNSRTLESQVKTVVAQTPNLGMTFLVADADDRNPSSFDQLNQLLNTTATFCTQHHNQKYNF